MSEAGPARARDARRPTKTETETRFLDAAERLLVEVGYASITTRLVASEAGANPGLVHYYFGSMEELFLQVLERFTDLLIERQRALYESPVPYVKKWRAAMGFLEEDRPYQKIWWELQAMAWNRPEYQARIAAVLAEWREAMRAAVGEALVRYRLDGEGFSAEDWVTLIVALNEGIILERLSGVEAGHAGLLEAIDRWLERHEQEAERRDAADAGS